MFNSTCFRSVLASVLTLVAVAGMGVSAEAADAPAGKDATGASAAVSLLANGGFEQDENSDQWPDRWERPKVGGSWGAENGNRFLRLSAAEPGQMVMIYHPVVVPANVQGLELKWRQRITDLKPGKQPWFDARIMLEFKDAEGNKLKPTPAPPNSRKNTDGWVERSTRFLVPEGAKTLEFMPALFQVEKGTFDLDDISLVAVDPAPLRAAAEEANAAKRAKQEKDAEVRRTKAATALKANGSLIANGDFEKAKAGDAWPTGWAKPKTGGSWEEENGNHFLRLKAVEPNSMTMLYQTFDIPSGTQALELSWRQRVTDLKPGKEPWFDARIMLEFKDATGAKMKHKPSPPNTRGNTKDWVDKTTRFLVPEGAVSLEFMPALFQVVRGTYDLDDFKLVPTEAAPLIAAAAAAEADRKAAMVPHEEPRPDRWPQELHVVGNQTLNKDGKPVWLQGVNVVSLEFLVHGDHVQKSILVAVDEWKSNIIRLPVKEEYWYGRASGQKDGGAGYRELVDQAIVLTANRGAYVLLDLHRFRAPRAEHVEFWKDAATKYKNHPAVLFDLFNEPHGTSWEVWQKGGFVAEKEKPADEDAFTTPEEKAKAAKGFQSVGMQALVDTVRQVGARNIVVVGGLDWAYDLSGIAKGHTIDERGGNGMMCSTHIYPWKKGWQEKVLCVAEKYPIMVGEVGADINKMTFIPAEQQEDAVTWVPDMLGLIQKHKFHWTAFSFHPKASPVMITGWDYTPTPVWGAFVKRALAGEQFPLKKLR